VLKKFGRKHIQRRIIRFMLRFFRAKNSPAKNYPGVELSDEELSAQCQINFERKTLRRRTICLMPKKLKEELSGVELSVLCQKKSSEELSGEELSGRRTLRRRIIRLMPKKKSSEEFSGEDLSVEKLSGEELSRNPPFQLSSHPPV
jgi:hypothetical protein